MPSPLVVPQRSRAEHELLAEWWFVLSSVIVLGLLGLACLGLWQLQPPYWGGYIALIATAAFGIVLQQWVRLTTTQVALARRRRGP